MSRYLFIAAKDSLNDRTFVYEPKIPNWSYLQYVKSDINYTGWRTLSLDGVHGNEREIFYEKAGFGDDLIFMNTISAERNIDIVARPSGATIDDIEAYIANAEKFHNNLIEEYLQLYYYELDELGNVYGKYFYPIVLTDWKITKKNAFEIPTITVSYKAGGVIIWSRS